MTPSNDLYNLIKSLTTPEKIFFKLNYSGKRVGGKACIKLYDAIDKQIRSAKGGEKYDEGKIKKQLGTSADTRLFSVIKNQLFHLILDTLCSYYPDDLPDFTVLQMIEKAKILNNKQLTNSAYKLIRKAKQEALKNELFPEALQALELERKIIRFKDTEVYEQLIADNLAEEKSVIEKHNNLTEYVHLQSKMFKMYRTNIIVRNEHTINFFKEMLQHHLLQNESSALSFRAKYFFYSRKVICYRHLSDPTYGESGMEKAYQYAQKLLSIFESEPMANYRIIMYMNTLHQMAIIQSFFGKLTDSMQSIRKIRDIGKSYPQFFRSIPPELPFRFSVMIETDLYLRIPDYETGVAQIPYIESDLKKFGNVLPKHTQYGLYYNIALLYFGIRDYHKALNWINKILNENKDDYALDLICGARILFLIIHIELGNDDLLEYAAQSTHRYLTTRKRKYKVESLFLDLLKVLLNPDRKKDLPKIYPQMLMQFKKLKTDPYEKGAFEYFDFISWLESKIENRLFAEVVRQKADPSYQPKN